MTALQQRARFMYDHALKWLNDAEILNTSGDAESDGGALLSILGFEVLLKCAITLCNQKAGFTHNYTKLWRALPGYVRNEVLAVAEARMLGHADLSDLDRLLAAYQYAFEQGRYYYDLYKQWTPEQMHELAEYWTELGAPVEEAQ